MSPESSQIYDIIGRRRDVRCQFVGGTVDPEVLERILGAAHAAPSVGLSQPWDFIVVDDIVVRHLFAAHVRNERQRFERSLSPERRALFRAIKIEGILEAALGIVVTYDRCRGAPSVLGRHTIDDAGLYSVCLAIENLWLAATAEGLGVGWVSFYQEPYLASLLDVPPGVRPVAWLCVGPVSHLEDTPDLERHGWRSRLSLDHVLHHNRWGRPANGVIPKSPRDRLS
jgi:5,6-dimethylbenzimidazole synthase